MTRLEARTTADEHSCEGGASAPSGAPPARRESGMTLIEVTIAIAIVSIGCLTTLATMTAAAEADEEMRERAIALRAVVSEMEARLAYDYAGDIANLVTWLGQPAQRNFRIEGLAPPVVLNDPDPPHGTVTVDATDIQRVVITINVRWSGRRGPRQLTIPMTVTEVQP